MLILLMSGMLTPTCCEIFYDFVLFVIFFIISYYSGELDRWIQSGLKRAYDELDDVIGFGSISCREWLSSLNAPKEKIASPLAKKK